MYSTSRRLVSRRGSLYHSPRRQAQRVQRDDGHIPRHDRQRSEDDIELLTRASTMMSMQYRSCCSACCGNSACSATLERDVAGVQRRGVQLPSLSLSLEADRRTDGQGGSLVRDGCRWRWRWHTHTQTHTYNVQYMRSTILVQVHNADEDQEKENIAVISLDDWRERERERAWRRRRIFLSIRLCPCLHRNR